MAPEPGSNRLRSRCRARHRSTLLGDTVRDLGILKAKQDTVNKVTLHSSALRDASEGMRHVALNVAFDAHPNLLPTRSKARR